MAGLRIVALGLISGLIAWATAGGRAVAAEQVPSSQAAETRAAISLGLTHLEKEGLAWMREKTCMTCHQIPAMVWSFNEANRHGFAVDGAKLKAWNQWAVDNGLKRARFYKITDETETALRAAAVADDAIAKLAKLKNKNFVLEYEFREALAASEVREMSAAHERKLLDAAAIEGKGGGGAPGANQYMAALIAGAAAGSADPAASRRLLVEGLVKSQSRDGSWTPASQFKMQQRSELEATEAVTLWSVLGLESSEPLDKAGRKAADQARAWLKKAPPEKSTEVLMLRAMLARSDGDETRSEDLADELLKLQHSDGGWGWLKDRQESDPFTTGMVLYGLATLEPSGYEAAVGKAREHLLKLQAKNGEWKLPQKTISAQKKEDTKNGDAIYSYWATGWAVVGLAATLPE